MGIRQFVRHDVYMIAGLLLLAVFPLCAAENSLHQVIGDVEIYLGVLPAEMVKGHPREHPESQMHGGVPAGTHYHIVVALFDTRSGRRITDAEVTVKVKGLAAPDHAKQLEPMLIAGAQTYGNYFHMIGYKKRNRIILNIRRTGTGKVIQATFDWSRS